MEERDYNEVYDNGNNLLDVFVHTGTYMVFSATNCKTRERKVFRTLQDLEAFLYNGGYHIIMSDRRQMFVRNTEPHRLRNVVWVTTRLDGSPREVCFLHGGKIRTGRALGVNEDNDNELTVRSNAARAYTNTEGYKTVSVPIENIVILSDY